jgi:hypothetical protein
VNIFRRLFGKETNGQEIVDETIATPKESSKDRARRMAHLISGRAKELYNKDTMKWTDCIRRASKELKEDGKL